MSYIYSAGYQVRDSDGRFTNLTQQPTVTAYNFLTGAEISGPTITNIRTGVYRVGVEADVLADVLFSIVPHVDDQANVSDEAVMQEKVYHVVDNAIVDIGEIAVDVDSIATDVDDILTDTGVTIPGDLSDLEDQVAAIASWTAQNIDNSATAANITQMRGDAWDFTISGLSLDGDIIQFVVKEFYDDADDESIVFIDTVTGLVLINEVEGTAGNGSLSYADGSLTVNLAAVEAAKLTPKMYVFGIQSVNSVTGAVSEADGGLFKIVDDVVRAVS